MDTQRRLDATPNALDTKQEHVATRCYVEHALYLWVKHMESKGEHVSSPMLEVKRLRFEDLFEVPTLEHMKSKGWVAKFTKTYETSFNPGN